MERNRVRSSGAMWYAILAAWGVGTALLAWRFAPYLTTSPSSFVLVFLLVCLSYFVLTGVFNVVVNATSHFLRDTAGRGGPLGRPRVAVLYCTYNDFDRGSAGSLLDLTYENLEVWVLDDSTRPDVRAEIDAFASIAPLGMFVDILRRPWFAVRAILVNTVAYVALFPVSVVGVLRGLSLPAQFLVTPKGSHGALNLRSAAWEARVELLIGGALLALGYGAFGPWGLASPLALSALSAPILMVASRSSLLRQRGRGAVLAPRAASGSG